MKFWHLVWAFAIFVALFLGCYPPSGAPDPTPQSVLGTTIAPPVPLAIVLGSYGTPGLSPGPRVRWETATPECGGIGWFEPFANECIRGVFLTSEPNVIVVATWPGALIEQTAFAHEIRHWFLFTTGQDPNANHTGDFYLRVDAANEALWEWTWRGE